MVKEIPSSGKSISRDSTFATFKHTKVRIITMSMESVGFTLMAKQTSIGRKLELGIQTGRDFASIWL
jgi:hypothetical protein